MSDVLSIVFFRWDRHPDSERYGAEIDRRLAEVTDGDPKPMPDGSAEAPIDGFKGMVEWHESGPIFRLDPAGLPAPILHEVRAIVRDWADRDTGHEAKTLEVSICYGTKETERVRVTRDPASAYEDFDELVRQVLREGTS